MMIILYATETETETETWYQIGYIYRTFIT